MTPDAQSLSVPVVEDNPLNAKLTRLVLQQEGCRVETAPNAPQALEILSRIKPRVILMDLQLPGMVPPLGLSRSARSSVMTQLRFSVLSCDARAG